MSTNSKTSTLGNQANTSQSLALGRNGVHTAQDFANVMSALMSDVLAGTIAPDVANAACNAGGKLLKAVEMQFKYGQKNADAPNGRTLRLTTTEAA